MVSDDGCSFLLLLGIVLLRFVALAGIFRQCIQRELIREKARHQRREAGSWNDLKGAWALVDEYAGLFYHAAARCKEAESDVLRLRTDCECWWNLREGRRHLTRS